MNRRDKLNKNPAEWRKKEKERQQPVLQGNNFDLSYSLGQVSFK